MRCVTLGEVLELHRRILQQMGGASGVHNLAALESAVTHQGKQLYQVAVIKVILAL